MHCGMNVLMNLAFLALNKGSGPGGDILREASPHEGPREQPPRRTNTRVGKVVQSIKTLQWSRAGTRGQGDPVERSQRMEEDPEGIEITWREVLEIREDVSGQDCCMRESS